MKTRKTFVLSTVVMMLFAGVADAQNANASKPNTKKTPKQAQAASAKVPPSVNPNVLAPKLIFKSSQSVASRNGKSLTSVVLSITNWADFPPELFASAPNLPPDPCGPGWDYPKESHDRRALLTVYSRDKKQIYVCHPYPSPKSLGFIRFYIEQGKLMPSGFLVVLKDRLKGTAYESNPVASSIASGANK